MNTSLEAGTAGLRLVENHIQTRAFPGKRQHVRDARTFVQHILAGCPVTGDAVLCVSEFASNAVLHSRSGEPGGQFLVRVEVYANDHVWVEVTDDGGPWQMHTTDSLPGHGLDIVGKLACGWGVDGGLGGWTVWARLDWPRC